ncbi:MAG: HAMP domain-containing protein [Verrucomicrobiales bacterium]|nr:HAMP domain-containing protein [Verrucomicrobiales bacterium]
MVSNPMFGGRRSFQRTQPFSYSGIDWGWISLGLSLDSYDRSVRTVYTRTGLLAVLCVMLGLMASVAYARKLVKPILSLRSAVERVAEGDLSARIEVEQSDEIGSLAKSFNLMTDAMLKRDRILGSVRFAAQQFLSATDREGMIDRVLRSLGEAARAGRASVMQNVAEAGGGPLLRREWVDGVLEKADDSGGKAPGFPADWIERFCCHETIAVRAATGDAASKEFLRKRGSGSALWVPVWVGDRWWGVLGLEASAVERIWTVAEAESVRTMADMLGAAILRQRGEDALIEANETLEVRVDERTRELQQQVEAKEQARAELAETQQRLVEVSRQSGMAEVATGVLHNVGNVLNSVNVSANLLHEWVRSTKIHSLSRAAAMLKEHEDRLVPFLTEDAKGRQIPGFVVKVAEHLESEVETVQKEVDSLLERVDHIKQIVTMQQGYASASGIVETLTVRSLVEDALRINQASLKRHGIEVELQCQEVPEVTVDKHAVLQILINLVRNAKDAMKEGTADARRMRLSIEPAGTTRIRVSVADNGIGIPRENLTRIFAHGFTTKKEGHGFGLHSGANAAKAMGGQLIAYSEGLGKGATLVLELPVAAQPLQVVE